MSPYPPQTDRDRIVAAARQLVEEAGVEGLSLARLASALGIKAPSLYRHIAGKEALIQAVSERTFQDLFQAYDETLVDAVAEPVAQIHALADAHRRFAHENPHCYMLAYATPNPELPPNRELLLERASAIQQIMAAISGEPDSLPALRGLLALVHGFVTLELNGQLRRGGDLAAAFRQALEAYLLGWQRQVDDQADRLTPPPGPPAP